MASREQYITHVFNGGWATDRGVTAQVQFGPVVQVPYLIDAENCLYELDGGPHKMPGTTSFAAGLATPVMGVYDYWDTGTGGSPNQHRIVHAGTTIIKDDADGSFTSLFTGLESGKVPAYSVLNDVLIMSSDSTTDVPKSWDGTTAQNLAGSPPNFAFSVTHKNRSWAAGDVTKASRLYYSVLLDSEDWAGSGSGSIDIDPDDGDEITGIASHRNELWVFKGPHKGSIHRITGSSPTGSDAFARTTFVEGVGAVGHNTIFRFANDLGFMWSDGSVRSLAATSAFGDFNASSLSRDINQGFIDARVNLTRLKRATAAVDDIKGAVIFTVPIDGSTNANSVLAMDFRFSEPRWSFLSDLNASCVASVIDQTDANRRVLYFGATATIGAGLGRLEKWSQSTRTTTISGASAGINFKVTTPHMNYGLPSHMKTISHASIGFAPKNSGSVTFGWQRDNLAQQTQTVTQGGSGAALDSFVLGTDVLGGASFVDRFLELAEGGQFRSVRYQVTHSTNNEDIEIHSIGAQLSIDDQSWENG